MAVAATNDEDMTLIRKLVVARSITTPLVTHGAKAAGGEGPRCPLPDRRRTLDASITASAVTR